MKRNHDETARPRMRLVGVAGEAWRDLATGTAHACALALVLAALIALLAGADWLAIRAIQRQTDAYVASGGSTWILEYDGHVDGAACDRLASLDGVKAAGAVRGTDERLVFAALPSTGVPLWEGTPGAVRVLMLAATGTSDAFMREPAPSGVLLSASAAEPFMAAAGDELPLSDGRVTAIAGVYEWPDDGRISTFAHAALAPVPADAARSFDQCWVRAWPEPDSLESLLRLATDGTQPAADGSQGRIQVSRLNTAQGTALDGAARFRERLTAWEPWVALAAALALGFVATYARRLEMASALHCGVPKTALAVQIALEALVWTMAGVMLTLPLFVWTALVDDGIGNDAGALTDVLVRVPVAAVAGAIAGALAAVALTRERRLQRYFKNR